MKYTGMFLGQWTAVVVLGWCVACGESGGGVDAGAELADAPIGPDGPRTTVTGSVSDHYVVPGSEQSSPRDLSYGFEVAAVSRDAEDGFSMHQGSGAQDGSFSVPSVRVGNISLQVGKTLFDVDPAELDLGARIGRRASAVRAALPTMIDARVDGITPWADGHELELLAPWVDGYLAVPKLDQPGSGDTRFATLFDYTARVHNMTGHYPFLIDAGQGDTLYMAQLVPRVLGDDLGTYLSVDRSFGPAQLTLSQEQTTRLRGDFEAVDPSQSLDVNWRGTAFEDLIATMLPPGATPSLVERTLSVHASPLPLASGASLASRGTLIRARLTSAEDAVLAMSYGNPYPADWAVAQELLVLAGQRIEGPGGTSVFMPAYYAAGGPLEDLTGTPLEPVIGPVQNPLIDGKDALSPQLGFADAPELSWDPPALGSADFYEVDVFRLDGNYRELLVTVRTTETSVTLPPHLFGLSERYVFRIRSHWSPNDPIWGPAGSYYPYAVASMVSEVIRR